jgi:hypothetical protein
VPLIKRAMPIPLTSTHCRPAVRGALRGCLALLSRRSTATSEPAAATSGPAVAKAGQQQQQQPAAVAEVGEGAAVVMMRTCASHVFIRALSQQDRTLALRLLVAAMQGYGDTVLAANLDLLEYVISSGESSSSSKHLDCRLSFYHAERLRLAALCVVVLQGASGQQRCREQEHGLLMHGLLA